MSIRTIIEINHDRLAILREDPEQIRRMLDVLGTAGPRALELLPQLAEGVRFIAQRHHTEELTITVD